MNPNNRFLASADDDAILCMACNKEVYPNDRVMALKGNWHRGCLKCTECGITLSVRMLESFQNKPYCRAHKPNPRSTQVTDSVAIKTATEAPKAVRREAGVKKDVRMSFFPGAKGAPNPLTAGGAAPHGYVPAKSSAPAASNRVQGVNKLERRTFFPGQSGAEQIRAGASSVGGQAASGGGGYEAYGDETSYDQGGQSDAGYDQGGDQGGYDQGGYDQGGYDQGDQGGYDQGGYDQGGYDQEGYDQGGYDQGGYDQEGYEQGGYEEEQQWS